MLAISIRNVRQHTRHFHDSGPLIVGRFPNCADPHLIIDDDYVSRRQLLLDQLSGEAMRVENLGRNDIELPGGVQIKPGKRQRVTLPTRLHVGRTMIEIKAAEPEADPGGTLYHTIQRPAQHSQRPAGKRSLASLGEAPSAETLAIWFETLVSVQSAAAGSKEFHRETAQAVVDLVGLDRGMVLLLERGKWTIRAGYSRHEEADFAYSKSVLQSVCRDGRTFYGNPDETEVRDSLARLDTVVASPVFDGHGEVIGALYGSRDRDPRKENIQIQPLEAQVVQMLATFVSAGLIRVGIEEKLKQVEQLAAVGQALGYIMHDLRGPLGNAQQLVHMLRDGDESSLDRDQQLSLVDESVAVSMKLLNDCLEFCRGNVQVQPVRGNCRDLFGKYFDLMQISLQSIDVELRIDVPEDLIVWLDAPRIARVLRNLSKNAGEALQGQPHAEVTIGARKTDDGTELWVADNGPGLPAEVQTKLFQPFASHGKRGGTGFGLAIAKQLVEAHGGQISVDTSDVGTRFSVALPDEGKSFQPPSGKVVLKKPLASADETITTSALSVLLVEDGLVNQKLISTLLESSGHAVTVAGNGEEAVELYKSRWFDLVLMDVEMPVMDGLQAARALRRIDATSGRRTPIVALTAYEAEHGRQLCTDAGMDGFLTKPVRWNELDELARTLFSGGK